MIPLEGSKQITELTNQIKCCLEKCEYIGAYNWGNPGGATGEVDTYKMTGSAGCVFVTEIKWEGSTFDTDRRGIISTICDNVNLSNISQIFEMTITDAFTKKVYTRVFVDEDKIEIRNYGRFTIGNGSAKMNDFFDYLRDKGYQNEICFDEEGKQYIKVLEVDNMSLSSEYFIERITKITYLVKEFKDYFRGKYITEN